MVDHTFIVPLSLCCFHTGYRRGTSGIIPILFGSTGAVEMNINHIAFPRSRISRPRTPTRMDNRLHPSITPCRFLRAGHCRSGDGCEYAHDSIPQPCLSASQISHRLDNLSGGSDITDPVERRRTHNLRARLLYKAKRRCIAPQLMHSGIIPTRKAIRKYYTRIKGRRAPAAAGAGECGPIGSIPTISAISCRSGDDGGDGNDVGGWVTVEAKSNERRLRKMQFRKRAPGHRPVRIVKRYYRTEQVRCPSNTEAAFPGMVSDPMGDTTLTRDHRPGWRVEGKPGVQSLISAVAYRALRVSAWAAITSGHLG